MGKILEYHQKWFFRYLVHNTVFIEIERMSGEVDTRYHRYQAFFISSSISLLKEYRLILVGNNLMLYDCLSRYCTDNRIYRSKLS